MSSLPEQQWETLVGLIRQKKCTPFIGAGASAGCLPSGGALAQEWALKHAYPLTDSGDLARVAQFRAIQEYDMSPKDAVSELISNARTPNFEDPTEPHGLLADLTLPIYISTNYDPFMVKAIKHRERKCRREFCRWNRHPEVRDAESVFEGGYRPEPSEPLVFYLHGYHDVPQSLVLTEDDYLDFLIRLSNDGRDQADRLLPSVIRTALSSTALMFVGYSLTDWTFRVLFRGLVSSFGAEIGYPAIAIQLPPDDVPEDDREKAQEYLNEYFSKIQKVKVKVYWGKATAFAKELRERLGLPERAVKTPEEEV
jgi:SIR2-like protein